MAKKRGRHSKEETKRREEAAAQNNADEVFLALAVDRDLTRMGPELEDPTAPGVRERNPVSGRKLKGQQRTPRSLTKEVLPEVCKRTKTPAKTIERHFYAHGKDSMTRMAAEMAERFRKSDEVRQSLLRRRDQAAASGDLQRMAEIDEKITQFDQDPMKVFRKK